VWITKSAKSPERLSGLFTLEWQATIKERRVVKGNVLDIIVDVKQIAVTDKGGTICRNNLP